tara:strand:+ start:464 stop:1084 length:621 start_codon:yes stop_codon:yes gene_type:complete
MAVVNNLNTDLLITNKINPSANITLQSATVYIDGDLQVGGNSTAVTKTDLEVTDNLITLNKGESGVGVTLGSAGIEVDRGSSSTVALRFNETGDKWQITNDGATYGNITTSATSLTTLVDDTNPTLGANLDVATFTISSESTDYVKFDSNLAVRHTSTAPSTVADHTVIYAQTPSQGGSGVYLTNTSDAGRQVSTVRNAIVYSLVL